MLKIKSVLCLGLQGSIGHGLRSTIGHLFIIFADNKENTHTLTDGHDKIIQMLISYHSLIVN